MASNELPDIIFTGWVDAENTFIGGGDKYIDDGSGIFVSIWDIGSYTCFVQEANLASNKETGRMRKFFTDEAGAVLNLPMVLLLIWI